MEMNLSALVLAFSMTFSCTAGTNDTGELKLMTANGHPMQYYVSLPENWTPTKKWPVVVVVEAAEKEFKENAKRFIAARKQMPFIIVAPLIVTNGNQGLKDPEIYPYSKSTWDQIDRTGNCRFDIDGLTCVMRDVQKSYSGEEKFFLTGFEAGAHLVWTFTFQFPERLRAAAPVAGNYRGRCMEEGLFSKDATRVELPIRGFIGQADSDWGAGSQLHGQWKEAKDLAEKNGYGNISEVVIPAKGHVPMPEEVLSYFYTLLTKK